MKDKESMSRSLYHLGEINGIRGNFERALKYMKESVNIDTEEMDSLKFYSGYGIVNKFY